MYLLLLKAVERISHKGWKLEVMDSLLKRICKTGTIVQQPGSRSCSARSDDNFDKVADPVISQDKPKCMFHVKLAIKCAQDNSP